MNALVRDRTRGVLLGVLAGDAAGAPYENKRSDGILMDFDERGGLALFDYVEPWRGKRHIPAGHPTDDAELTAAFAISLVAQGRFDATSVYANLRAFIHGENGVRHSFLTDGDAYGSGGTLRAALRAPTYRKSFKAFREGNVRVIPSNGALMRCAPAGLVGYSVRQCGILGRKQSCITHIHPSSQAACEVYAMLIRTLVLSGCDIENAWDVTRDNITGWCIAADLKTKDKIRRDAYWEVSGLDVATSPSAAEIWPQTGDVMLSLRIALWGALNARDFRDGLIKVIGLGGDTDTYGAIAGGILGARFGAEGIPNEWREKLIGREIMEDLADRLIEIT